jgi:hypothetical protein
MSTKKNRPILLLNFDVLTSHILLHTNKYSTEVLNIEKYNFYNLTIYINDGTFYTCYILNHLIEPGSNPKIIIAPNKQEQTIQDNETSILKNVIPIV